MASRLFQTLMVQMKAATTRAVGVMDYDGTVIACSELSLIGAQFENITGGAAAGPDRVIVYGGRTLKLIGGSEDVFEHAVFTEGMDDYARSIAIMAAIAVTEVKTHYEEKHDVSSMMKNILTGNILPGDIYAHAKELHFVSDVPRAVLLVRQVGKKDAALAELLRRMFPDRQKNFILSISESDIAVIREVVPNVDMKEIDKIAEGIESAALSELNIKTVIGICTPAKHLGELADRYHEVQVAIDVGSVFEEGKTIINYENLGIGRLIYLLPNTLCEMYLSEVFKKNPIDTLDNESLVLINKFFENNLNISETSRKLFVHRNTLVYRLGKIKKLTGLDLREFDQAVVFKVALMVKQYLDSKVRRA